MQCLSPVRLGERGGVFACGRCAACRINRTQEWSLRLMHERNYWRDAGFFTLTYADDFLPHDYGLRKDHLQRFFKRLRKEVPVKYYACGEYGEKFGRPHYHAVIFGVGPSDGDLVDDVWKMGNVHVGTLTYDSAAYVAGYIQKKLSGPLAQYGGRVPPFQLQSQGMGARWLEDNTRQVEENLYITRKGVKLNVPRYYRKIMPRIGVLYDVERARAGMEERRMEEWKKLEALGATDELSRAALMRALRRQRFEEFRTKAQFRPREPFVTCVPKGASNRGTGV